MQAPGYKPVLLSFKRVKLLPLQKIARVCMCLSERMCIFTCVHNIANVEFYTSVEERDSSYR